jgi:hypothetical protein
MHQRSLFSVTRTTRLSTILNNPQHPHQSSSFPLISRAVVYCAFVGCRASTLRRSCFLDTTIRNAAVSTAAAFAPSAAYAQSGKRICGVIWQHKTNKNRKRAVFMKVNKNDRFYCAAIFGDAYLLSRGGREWVSPKNYYHVACEEFSRKMGLNYNVCPGVNGYEGITTWR